MAHCVALLFVLAVLVITPGCNGKKSSFSLLDSEDTDVAAEQQAGKQIMILLVNFYDLNNGMHG